MTTTRPIFTEKLNLLFQKKLSNRELMWLWGRLAENGFSSSIYNLSSIDLHEEMADFISKTWWSPPESYPPYSAWEDRKQWEKHRSETTSLARFWGEVGSYLDKELLDLSHFEWIKEKGRQPLWLRHKIGSKNLFLETSDLNLLSIRRVLDSLSGLSDKERFIFSLDSLTIEIEEKLRRLKRLKDSWSRQIQGEKPFSWYTREPRQEKKKLECAWEWYTDKNAGSRKRLPLEFSKLGDLLIYIDTAGYSLEESLYHLEQIKKKFKYQQVTANRKNKKQTNLSLSDDAREKLELLAAQEKMTRTEIVELLIEKAHENGI